MKMWRWNFQRGTLFITIHAEHLVLDFNGTLAVDGHSVEDVVERFIRLNADLEVHLLTADTFGTVRKELRDLPITVKVLDPADQDRQKAASSRSSPSSPERFGLPEC